MQELPITPNWSLPTDEFSFEYSRSSGPGGQNVNKVSSKATLRWNLVQSRHVPEHLREQLQSRLASRLTRSGELLITSQRTRDQDRNREDCLERLTELLREAAHRDKPRRATRPTAGSRRRRLTNKRARGEVKRNRRGPGRDE